MTHFARQKQQLLELPGREGRWSSEFRERMQQPAIPLAADGVTLMIESRDSVIYSGC